MKIEFSLTVHKAKEYKKIGTATMSIDGEEPIFARHKSHVYYKVLSGSLVIETQNDYYPLSAGQAISFRPYTYYRKTGVATILAIDNPPYDADSSETLAE